MDFTYTGVITIENKDLDKMVEGIKSGYSFSEVFNDVMSWYDDEDYYSSYRIIEQVEEVINKRLSGT